MCSCIVCEKNFIQKMQLLIACSIHSNHFYPCLSQHVQMIDDAILSFVIDPLHVTDVDEHLAASSARRMGDENVLFDVTRCIAVDDGVVFRMQTTTVAGNFRIARVVLARRTAVVSHAQHFAKIRRNNHRTHLQTLACGSTS